MFSNIYKYYIDVNYLLKWLIKIFFINDDKKFIDILIIIWFEYILVLCIYLYIYI